MIKFTDTAAERIHKAVFADGSPANQVFRISIAGVGPQGFTYDFALDEEKYILKSDTVVESHGFKTVIDQSSSERLQGATVGWQEDDMGKGSFQIENPNNPKIDSNNPLVQKVQEVIDQEINPAIASHGGFIELIDIKEGRAFVKMGGGCQGCGMSEVTLKQGVATLIRDSIPEIKEVVDTTDHAGGTNPYYTPK